MVLPGLNVLRDTIPFLSTWVAQELSWKGTEDLVVMQPSVIPFSLMVSGRDYPGLFLICGLSGNAFGESRDCVRLCVLSVLKEAPGWTGSCPEPVSSAPHFSGCSSAPGPAAVTSVTAPHLSRLALALHWHHWWQDLPLPLFHPLTLSMGAPSPALPRAAGVAVAAAVAGW